MLPSIGFLHHRDIQTTMRCAHLAPSHVRDGINKGSLGTLTETRIEAKASEGESTEVVDTCGAPDRT